MSFLAVLVFGTAAPSDSFSRVLQPDGEVAEDRLAPRTLHDHVALLCHVGVSPVAEEAHGLLGDLFRAGVTLVAAESTVRVSALVLFPEEPALCQRERSDRERYEECG